MSRRNKLSRVASDLSGEWPIMLDMLPVQRAKERESFKRSNDSQPQDNAESVNREQQGMHLLRFCLIYTPE